MSEKLAGEKQIRPTHILYPEMVLRFDLTFAYSHKSRTIWKFYCLPPANIVQRQFLVGSKSRTDFPSIVPRERNNLLTIIQPIEIMLSYHHLDYPQILSLSALIAGNVIS